MNASRGRPRFYSLVLALCVLSASCTGDGSEVSPQRDAQRFGGIAVVVNNDDLDNLNGLVAAQKYSQEVNQYLVFLPLLGLDAGLNYQPRLARRWEMSGDTAATFELRRDVRWHDGELTSARDVVFTFERVLDPASGYPNADFFSSWTGVTAVDSFTVRVSFDAHADPLAGVPFLPIMPAHLLDSIPPERMRQAAFNKRPVGNGPFRFTEYRANDRWVFDANPDFPGELGGRPYLDRIVWRVVPDPTAQIAEITTGAADVVLTPPSTDYPRLVRQEGLRGIDRPSRQYAMIIWNGRVRPLDDARVRHALTLAIDRAQIVETLRGGYGRVAVGPVAPFHWSFDDSLEPLPFDPDSARTVLRAAGLADLNGDGFVQYPDGRAVAIELKLPAGSAINRDMAEMIRSNLAAVGVRIVTRPLDVATMQQDVIGAARNFEGVILAWNSAIRLNFRDTFHSDSRTAMFGAAGYANPRVDQLIDGVQVARTREQAAPLYTELQRILRDEQPWGFLYYYSDLVVLRDRLEGVEMDIRGALVNVQDWWLSEGRRQVAATPGDSAGRRRDPDPARGQ
jgi:peptide/nickel transport system substrate-binding protein